MTPLFLGLSGLTLTDDERALFGSLQPAGYILFRRNVDTPEQLRALTDSLRMLSGNERLPILIDQEGGRVARLRPPHWPAFPTGAAFDRLYDSAPISAMQAARLNGRALGTMLNEVGVTVDCLPLLDVVVPGAHDVIGDRALGTEPLRVAALGRATLDGLKSGGCVGVVKHIPGHGRAGVDSHHALPVVTATEEELEQDLAPFIRLKDAPMAMTAHVLYTAWDADRCATLSPFIVQHIIRERVGFAGLLMTDDLGMHALASQPGGNSMAGRMLGSLDAGCDIALHCSGNFAEMAELAEAAPSMTDVTRSRLDRAMAWATLPANPADLAELATIRDRLLGTATVEIVSTAANASPVDVT